MDRALEQAKEGVVDIMGIVNGMRQQRMKMVQTLVSSTDSGIIHFTFNHLRTSKIRRVKHLYNYSSLSICDSCAHFVHHEYRYSMYCTQYDY